MCIEGRASEKKVFAKTITQKYIITQLSVLFTDVVSLAQFFELPIATI